MFAGAQPHAAVNSATANKEDYKMTPVSNRRHKNVVTPGHVPESMADFRIQPATSQHFQIIISTE